MSSCFILAGAIMFRGYEVEKGIDFQDIIQQFNPDLCDEYRGTSPRRLIPGTKVLILLNVLIIYGHAISLVDYAGLRDSVYYQMSCSISVCIHCV